MSSLSSRPFDAAPFTRSKPRLGLSWVGVALAACLAPEALSAQTSPLAGLSTDTVISQFDDVQPGLGAVTLLLLGTINDSGTTLVAARTEASLDLLLKDGQPLHVSGEVIDAGVLRSPHRFVLDDAGHAVQIWFLDSSESALLWDSDQLLATGDACTLSGVPAGATYETLLDVQVNDAGQVLLYTSLAIPASPSLAALIRLDTNGSGQLTGGTLLALEGDLLPGQTQPARHFLQGQMDASGHAAFVLTVAAFSNQDNSIYRDGVLLAKELGPSPVPGRNWAELSGAQPALGSAGSYAYAGVLTGDASTDELLVVDGQVFRQKGDTVVDALWQPQALRRLDVLGLAEDGGVFWASRWLGPGGIFHDAVFLNDLLLLDVDVSVVNGLQVTEIPWAVPSPDGDWLLAAVRLANGTRSIVRLDVGPWRSLGQGLAGQAALTPQLRGSGRPTAGQTISLDLFGARPGASATVVLSTSSLSAAFKGGTLVPQPDFLLNGLAVDAGGAASLPATWPAGIPAGIDLYMQAWLLDPAGAVGFAASNGLLTTSQ